MNETPKYTVRPVTLEEIPECIDFALPLFSQRFPEINREALEQHAAAWVADEHVFVYRTDHAVGAAYLEVSLWEPYVVVVEQFVASDPAFPGEGRSLYMAMIEWGKLRGAKKFRFGSANGVDIKALAERLGAQPTRIIYELDLTEDG